MAKVYNFGSMKFYAEQGVAHIIDEHTGEYYGVTRHKWQDRIEAFKELYARETDISERVKYRQLIDDMEEVDKALQKQGDPTDPKVLEFLEKHRPFRRTAVSVPVAINNGQITKATR